MTSERSFSVVEVWTEDLPIEDLDLAIKLKTAKAHDLNFPLSLLRRGDEVIHH